MAFCLAKAIDDLKDGEEMKMKVDWVTYRVNENGDISYSAVVWTLGQILTPWLSRGDLELLGFQFFKLKDWEWNSGTGDKPGSDSLQNVVNILWKEIRLNENGEIEAVKGDAVVTNGKKLQMKVDEHEFANLGFHLDDTMPLLTRYFAVDQSSEVLCESSRQNFCNILKKSVKSSGGSTLLAQQETETFSNDFLRTACSSSITSQNNQTIRMGNNQNAVNKDKQCKKRISCRNKKGTRNKENFSHPLVKNNPIPGGKKYICLICNKEEEFPCKIKRHLTVHDEKFCDICQMKVRSESHHMRTRHGIIIKKKVPK